MKEPPFKGDNSSSIEWHFTVVQYTLFMHPSTRLQLQQMKYTALARGRYSGVYLSYIYTIAGGLASEGNMLTYLRSVLVHVSLNIMALTATVSPALKDIMESLNTSQMTVL